MLKVSLCEKLFLRSLFSIARFSLAELAGKPTGMPFRLAQKTTLNWFLSLLVNRLWVIESMYRRRKLSLTISGSTGYAADTSQRSLDAAQRNRGLVTQPFRDSTSFHRGYGA